MSNLRNWPLQGMKKMVKIFFFILWALTLLGTNEKTLWIHRGLGLWRHNEYLMATDYTEEQCSIAKSQELKMQQFLKEDSL